MVKEGYYASQENPTSVHLGKTWNNFAVRHRIFLSATEQMF